MRTLYDGYQDIQPRLTPPVSAGRDHIQGRPDGPVALVEYGDFECPFCGSAQPVVKAVREAMGDELCFVFRHFPLTNAHPHAWSSAEAAEAAAAQGRFWDMHDTLYENQQALDDQHLVLYAERLGLDPVRFARELVAHVHAARVQEDFVSGVESGVNGTPTFFINGVRHDGAWDKPALLAALRAAATDRA